MAPIRRYLRITKYSVLEVRVYLDRPSDAAWLLSSRDPVLPRILHAVRPKVLPKLREENEFATSGKRKSAAAKKKRGIKDVAAGDDFEVSIFLKDSSTRHSLITKRKTFSDKPRLRSTSRKLTGSLDVAHCRDDAIRIDDDEGSVSNIPNLRQDPDEGDHIIDLAAIPDVDAGRRKRKQKYNHLEREKSDEAIEEGDAEDALFVSSSDEDFFQTQKAQGERPKRRKRAESNDTPSRQEQHSTTNDGHDDEDDDKKKLGLKTTYDGFSIYGRILCLIVRRKGTGRNKYATTSNSDTLSGSQMMEQWVSTQVGQETGLDDTS